MFLYRNGEPKWAEVSRLIVRVLLFFVLITFLIYNINDVMTSTISTSTSFNDNTTIKVPGISYYF
jgi:hypothetical protein